MELRNRSKRIMSLPGGDRRGAPGADAGRHSIRAIGGEGLGGRPFAGGPTLSGNPEQSEFTHSINSQDIQSVAPAEDVSQAAPATYPATTKAGKPRVRMKWDNEINTFIMRTYLYVTKLETDRTMYCKNLHDRFILKYPHVNVSAQRIADQRRVIVRNKLLPDTVIEQIKSEVREQLDREEANITQQHNDNSLTPSNNSSFDDNSPLSNLLTRPPSTLPSTTQAFTQTSTIRTTANVESHTTQPEVDTELIQKLTDKISTTLTEYSGIDPATRPRLPRLRENKKLYKLLNIFNTHILCKFYSIDSDISHIHNLIYCSALVISKELGYNISTLQQRNNKKKQHNKPAWQIRIERDIEKLRKDIGRVSHYIMNSNRSDKLIKKVEEIFSRNKLHSTHEKNNKRPEEFLDTLKQKLSLKVQRLKRYKKALHRKEDNKLFNRNEKMFYRNLHSNDFSNKEEVGERELPTRESLQNYWTSIWKKHVEFNYQADWIKEEERKYQDISEMEFVDVDREDIEKVSQKMKSWKSPGIDGIHSFWYKKFYSLHDILGSAITDMIKGIVEMPRFLTKGLTYMLPKSNNTSDPSQYRPITCLPTLYKLITSCITNKLNTHIENNRIMAEEQKGCRRNHLGCKEQLIIDSTILKHAHKNNNNLNITYIDYKKAFDSVPHSWLIRVLQIYKVNPTLITFLENTMADWRTTLLLTCDQSTILTEEIPIENGIFQGDSLSPLWFCLALNPLSNLLNNSENGYNLTSTVSVSHLMYMDDIKLFSKTERAMKNLIDITKKFSCDINMSFGLDKCRTLRIMKGKVRGPNTEQQTQTNNENLNFQLMDSNDTYKYLGIHQAKGIQHIKIKKTLTQEYFRRVNLICKRQLYSKNLFKAINTFAIPVLTYTFGVVKWTKTDIHKLEIKTRTTLTKNNYLHPKSAIERTTIKHHECNKLLTWRSKELHGRHLHDLEQPHIHSGASNKWLKVGALFPETEGFIIAIQDQVINTRNYKKYILKDPNLTNDKCRKCNRLPETIQHITSACPSLTQTDYTHRHNQICNIIHQKIALKHKLIAENPPPYYQYTPKPVLESSSHKLYYDRAILTDRTVHNNRPDITLIDKPNKTVHIIDIAVPNTHNLHKTITEKIHKYTELKDEILHIWKMEKVFIVPLVLSSTGVIPRHLITALHTLDLPEYTYISMQKAAILNTCRIVRKFLQDDNTTQTILGNETYLA
ncbi:hypothetical protein ABMA28_009402 [Loxostege sticticalis]|uniref:Reverse transcriptase domain-containing protein n=1 Tax=Loxostege sticticalis TaxID=481309 RepID=A0ABD0SD66_LOXSC